MRIDKDGWLVAEAGDPEIVKIPTERTTTLLTPSGRPVAIVSHWSADPVDERGHGDSVAMAKSIAKRPPPDVAGASWHLLIDRDGACVQSAPFVLGTWHVGKPGTVEGRTLLNVNRGTIGIELENAGRLLQVAGRWYGWPFWNHDPKDPARKPNPKLGPNPKYEIPLERAKTLDPTTVWGRGVDGKPLSFTAGTFEAYTEAQERSFELVARALSAAYGLPDTAFRYGHAHFVPPTYKEDPGPIWLGEVLPRILARIFPPRAAA